MLAWSQDRVGALCRTVEDCAMVFNVIHGVDPKDPSTVTTPFRFDPHITLASMRIGVDANAPKEFVDGLRELGVSPREIGPRPQLQGGGALGAESAAAFDSYVQWKAKELGIDLASLPEPQPGRGGRGGNRAARGDGRGDTTAVRLAGTADAGGRGGGRGDPGNPTGIAAITRWTNGRYTRAFDFIQAQRRRYILITQMADLLKDLDMYVPAGSGPGQYDVGLHAQTGHPCVVVPYKFDSPPPPFGGRGGRGGADTTGAPPIVYNKQPICAVLAGNLYNDDKILSVAHQYQIHTNWHLKHPSV